MNGWFALRRGTLDHPLFTPRGRWSRFEAWCWLIETATFKPTVIDIGGRPHTLPRGALCHSLRFMASRWGWSVKAVRTFLASLERHQAVQLEQVGTESGSGTPRTQITLCNYDRYQTFGHSAGTAGARNGHKEEQGNKSHVEPDGSTPPMARAEDAPSPADPARMLFDAGLAILGAAGGDPARSRTLLGRWRKQHGDAAVIAALGRAQREGAIDPVSFIEGALRFARKASVAQTPEPGEVRMRPDGTRVEWCGGLDGWLPVRE
jgi:hypothetical protein